MATIDKKLIHFNRKADFEARLAAGEIRDYSIVCIKDAKLIWTHGQYYGDLSECLTKYPQEFTKEEKDQMLENLGYYFIEWDGYSDSIELSEEEYAKFSASTIPLLVADGMIFYPITVIQGYGAFYKMEAGSSSMTFTVYALSPPVLNVLMEEINIPSKVSDLENDSSFVSAVDTGEEVDGVEADYVTEAAMNAALSSKQNTITDLSTIRSGASKGATAVQPSELASVAKSGSYNDLTNKPTIPSAVTESTVNGWGFTKNTGTYSKPSAGIPKSDLASDVQASLGKADTALQSYTEKYTGTYSKPSGGIPKSDLASAVQTSLGKADTALQSYTEQYKGTVTGVKMNGTTKNPSSGVVDLGTVITAHQDLSGYQPKLVSGTNIKTINGQSLLGSGNIVIEGGSSSGGGGGAYAEVNHGTGDTTFALTPNTFHVWDEVASLDLSFADETAGVANEYLFQFTSGATATTLTLPDGLKWANDSAPTIAENMIYQISILKGLASVLVFSYEVPSVFPITLTVGSTTEEGRMAYNELVNIGESGTLSEGLLVINGPGTAVHYVTSFSYNTSRNAYGLGSRGMTHYFLNVDGYCFTMIID